MAYILFSDVWFSAYYDIESDTWLNAWYVGSYQVHSVAIVIVVNNFAWIIFLDV